MKKYWIYMFLLMAIIAMPFTACSNDDELKAEEENLHNPESDEDQTEVLAYDALEWLQGCLAVVDENGEVVRRIYGTPLDASLPTVLSVAVSDLAMAEKTFLGWVAPGKEATKVEPDRCRRPGARQCIVPCCSGPGRRIGAHDCGKRYRFETSLGSEVHRC